MFEDLHRDDLDAAFPDNPVRVDHVSMHGAVMNSLALIIDVIVYPFITDVDKVLIEYPIEKWGEYDNRLKIGGVKITIDGSSQGRIARFTTPYMNGGPAGEKDWLGELNFPQDTVNHIVKKVYDLGVPLNLHENGDGAIDAFFIAHQ